MPILDRVSNFIRKSLSGLARPERWLKESLGAEETIAGIDVTGENSFSCSAVAACVRLLSESVASLPLHVYQQEGSDKRKATDHQLYSVLHDRPNPYQTSYTWRQQSMAHVLMHGNAYSAIERDDSDRVKNLWPLLPQNVTVKVKDGEISYEYFAGAERQVYSFDQVLHVKGPTLDGICGMSIVHMAREGIGLALAELAHGASTFRNRARPALAMKTDWSPGPEQMQQLRKSFESMFTGAFNSGKMVLLGKGMELVPIGFTNEDAQFLQSRQFSIQEIARWFRVSPAMIGDLSRSTYSNSEQEQLSFMVHTLQPWCINFESEINAALFARSSAFAEFDLSAVARGDLATRYEAYSKGLAARFLTVADVRRWENLPFIPGTESLGGNNGTSASGN